MTELPATRPDRPRRTRFRRDTPPVLRLTADDLAVIGHVARHRFLRSTHIVRLMPGRSEKKLIERLGALYHNQYLDRPRAQLDYYATAGSAPMVYALGNRGARVLAEHGEAVVAEIDWTWKNRSAGRAFIEHTLLVADCQVGLLAAVRRRPNVRLISSAEIVAAAPEPVPTARTPLKLAVRVTVEGTAHDLALVPDGLFGLDFTAERKRKYFCLEADRATMPVVRSNLAQTSVYRKFLIYLAGGGSANAFGRHLGIGNFRVLVVTTSRERQHTMIAALRQATHGTGSRQFLFVDREAVANAADLLTMTWLSGKGDMVRLID